MTKSWHNQRAAGKGGIPSLFRTGRVRPALPEHEGWAKRGAMADAVSNRMKIDIASPPDREKLVAQLSYDSEQWAEINQESTQLTLELYPRRDGQPWEFSFDEAITRLQLARRRLIGDDAR